MKKIIFGLIATVMFVNFSCAQKTESETTYFNTKLNFNYKFKDRNELVSLIKRIVVESQISNMKTRDIPGFQLDIKDNNELTYIPNPDSNSSLEDSGPCPDGYTFHGKFTDENEIAKVVAGIAAPLGNCCPKVTIIMDRVLTGVNICSKIQK